MIWIRNTISESRWGHLFSIQHDKQGRDLWVVEFTDGGTDVWPSWGDPTDYDVRIQIEAPEERHVDQVIEASTAAGAESSVVPNHPLVSWGRQASRA